MKKKGGVEVDKITGIGAFAEGINSWAKTYATSAEVVYEDQDVARGQFTLEAKKFYDSKERFSITKCQCRHWNYRYRVLLNNEHADAVLSSSMKNPRTIIYESFPAFSLTYYAFAPPLSTALPGCGGGCSDIFFRLICVARKTDKAPAAIPSKKPFLKALTTA